MKHARDERFVEDQMSSCCYYALYCYSKGEYYSAQLSFAKYLAIPVFYRIFGLGSAANSFFNQQAQC